MWGCLTASKKFRSITACLIGLHQPILLVNRPFVFFYILESICILVCFMSNFKHFAKATLSQVKPNQKIIQCGRVWCRCGRSAAHMMKGVSQASYSLDLLIFPLWFGSLNHKAPPLCHSIVHAIPWRHLIGKCIGGIYSFMVLFYIDPSNHLKSKTTLARLCILYIKWFKPSDTLPPYSTTKLSSSGLLLFSVGSWEGGESVNMDDTESKKSTSCDFRGV